MSTLIGIETRLRAESRNINYSGFNVDSTQKAYIDYQTAKGTAKAAKLGIAAEAMAADIRAAFATGQLTEAETKRLQGVLSEIVGDASLAQAYADEEYSLAQDSVDEIDSGRGAGDNNLESIADGYLHGEGTSKIPQGLTSEQFSNASKLIIQEVGGISDDIVVQGSRVNGTAKVTSDIDFAIRVSPEQFDDLIKQRFGTPNVGTAKERTMLHAIETGKIQSGEAGLRGFEKEITGNTWN